MCIASHPSHFPELMFTMLEANFRSGATFQGVSDFLMEPLNRMYKKLLRTKDRDRRFEIYKRANEYIADQAFWVFTMAPLALYGVNEEVEFVPQVSQFLYLDYSSVTDNHWSVRGKRGPDED